MRAILELAEEFGVRAIQAPFSPAAGPGGPCFRLARLWRAASARA